MKYTDSLQTLMQRPLGNLLHRDILAVDDSYSADDKLLSFFGRQLQLQRPLFAERYIPCRCF